MTEEARIEYLKGRNQRIREGWAKQTADVKKNISEMRKREWTDERKNHNARVLSARWNGMSESDQQSMIQKLSDGKVKYWDDVSHRKYHSERARKKWYEQSPQDRERILAALEKGRIEFNQNITPEQRAAILKKQSESMKQYWAHLSPDERDERLASLHSGLKEEFDHLNIMPNRNEQVLIKILDDNNIQYEFVWYNRVKHPEFDRMFPVNPAKPSSTISPFHAWDFRIRIGDTFILLDVDGSIHDPLKTANSVTDGSGNKFILSDYIQFKDSQRPYQTDGLDAYILRAYDNNITAKSQLVQISSNNTCTLDSFISKLRWLSLPAEDRNWAIRELCNSTFNDHMGG